ncbi:MAG: SAM-dependent chlorinase/fluorinase [Nitrososphaerota archaeon]|nr:SAM-dependent chlorinase/fluorinase [Candidatus Calditenuaceae archaeon]MDW8073809.1 SAM-dependent chlorinase/fluorinase [Nitrososphaerota archaeon]
MRVVTLLTDFGISDPYVAETKGAILSRCGDAMIIDITHQVEPFNIRQGALLLLLSYRFFPPGTIHVAVVDPGVGTERRGLVLRTRSYWFVGPDNGLLYPAAVNDGLEESFEIALDKYPRIGGETFHARDVFGPVAGELASEGTPALAKVSPDSLVRLELGVARFISGVAETDVLHVDRFGNAILNMERAGLPDDLEVGDVVVVEFGDKSFDARYVRAYGDVPPGSLLVTFGGTGLLEVAVSRGSAAALLGVKPGDRLRLRHPKL